MQLKYILQLATHSLFLTSLLFWFLCFEQLTSVSRCNWCRKRTSTSLDMMLGYWTMCSWSLTRLLLRWHTLLYYCIVWWWWWWWCDCLVQHAHRVHISFWNFCHIPDYYIITTKNNEFIYACMHCTVLFCFVWMHVCMYVPHFRYSRRHGLKSLTNALRWLWISTTSCCRRLGWKTHSSARLWTLCVWSPFRSGNTARGWGSSFETLLFIEENGKIKMAM